ncbi:MAG: hypothetical protein Q3W98_04270, partial [Collinsella sp.]|nr:hypothetical protein [Collinsella sp.]
AWWAAQRHAYIEKNDILLSDYPSWEWVSPYDFWRTIFPEGFLQPRGGQWGRITAADSRARAMLSLGGVAYVEGL